MYYVIPCALCVKSCVIVAGNSYVVYLISMVTEAIRSQKNNFKRVLSTKYNFCAQNGNRIHLLTVFQIDTVFDHVVHVRNLVRPPVVKDRQVLCQCLAHFS